MEAKAIGRARGWARGLGGIAATLCGVAVTPHAHAQSSVSLYGIVDMWAGAEKLPGNHTAAVVTSNGMSTSFWGMGGKEDLGGGLRTIFAIEGFFRPDSGKFGSFDGDTTFSRNAYVGLQSDQYGTLTLGRQSSPLYLQATLYNPFYASFTFSPTVNHLYGGVGTYPAFTTDQGVFGGTAWANAAQYASPDFHGLNGKAMYAFGGGTDNSSKKWSTQLNYANGPFSASAVYQYLNFTSTPGDLTKFISGEKSQSAAEIGAFYDLRWAKLYGEYTWIDNSRTGAPDFHVNAYQAGVSIPLGTSRILASYGYERDAGGLNLTRQTATIGYDFPLSKRTDLYANYMYDHLTNASSGYTTGVGIRTRF